MIYTSYFGKMKQMDNEELKKCVSISLWTPKDLQGKIEEYKSLAPTKEILLEYKNNPDMNKYIRNYCLKVLKGLDPEEVYRNLNEKILLCYEKPEAFCHRQIVSYWLNQNGFDCEEL